MPSRDGLLSTKTAMELEQSRSKVRSKGEGNLAQSSQV